MKIFIDIGHPAHVHYFKNFIKIMQQQGHDFFISARNKEFIHQLLDYHDLPYQTRGKGKKSLAGKFLYILKADILLFLYALRFKPNLFLSFASPYAAHVAWLIRKPHIVFDDTEHATLNHWLYKPFSREILTPSFFQKHMGFKHKRFNSLMELCYLHPNYYVPDQSGLENYGIKAGTNKTALIRLVSWNANHDVGQSGLNKIELDQIIDTLKPTHQILMSAEGNLPEKYRKYQFQLPPEKMHDLLTHTNIFITEGATMATEAALLGTPVIYINSLNAGTLELLAKHKLIINLRDASNLEQHIQKLTRDENVKEKWQSRKEELIRTLTDPTRFMVDHISKYEKQ
jgi:predicted glycosyltransferase